MAHMTDDAPEGSGRLRRLLPLGALIALAALVIAAYGDALSFETLRDNRAALIAWTDAHFVLAAVTFFAAYVAVVALSLPGGAVMTLTGGFLFGLLPGATLTVVAATIGATILFVVARLGLGDALYARLKAQGSDSMLARIENGLRENEVSYLLIMRLVPAIPFFVANLAPAFLGVSLRNYVLTTLVGIIPATFIYTWVGVGLGEVFDRGGEPNLGLLFEPHVLGPLLGLAALAALPIALKALRKFRAA